MDDVGSIEEEEGVGGIVLVQHARNFIEKQKLLVCGAVEIARRSIRGPQVHNAEAWRARRL